MVLCGWLHAVAGDVGGVARAWRSCGEESHVHGGSGRGGEDAFGRGDY
jgi:hypothetical protein